MYGPPSHAICMTCSTHEEGSERNRQFKIESAMSKKCVIYKSLVPKVQNDNALITNYPMTFVSYHYI